MNLFLDRYDILLASSSLLCYIAIFIHELIHKYTNELCIILYTGVTATAKTSVVRFTGFHPTQPYLEGGHCFADKLLF